MQTANENKIPQLNLNINAQRSFVKFFSTLGEKPATTVRFFDRNDFYSVYGEDDSQLISKLVYKTTASIRQLLPDETEALPYVSLSKGNFEIALRELLLVRNYRVEVFVKSDENSKWAVEFRGSPGNLLQFEDILFANKEILVGNGILSLHVRMENNGAQRKIGVAFVEQNDCQFHLLEFVDDDFLTELEATIVLLGPKECLLPAVDGEYENMKKLLERNGVLVTPIKKSSNAAEKNNLIQDLNQLLRFEKGQQEDCSGFPELKLPLSMEALRAALKYLELTKDDSNLHHYEFKQIDLKRFVHLDSAAVAALNIFPKPGLSTTSASYRSQSILGVLDYCRTPQGHRLMANWVKQPLRNREILNDRHNIVQVFLEAPETLKNLHDDYLKRIPDILMLTKKLLRHKASLQDLFRLYQVILRTPKIINSLIELDNTTINSVFCEPLKSDILDLAGLKQMIEQVVDFDSVESGEYLVKASFDVQLQEMKERMDKLYARMERLQAKAAEDLNLNQVKLENVSHIGHHFRITVKEDAELRKNKNYRIIDVVNRGVRFTTEKLEEYSAEFGEIRAKYETHQKTIVEEVIQVALSYAGPLSCLNSEIAELDCLVSFAIAARSAPTPYVRPKMLEEGAGVLILKEVRHPCLELQENVTFIANNAEFKKDVCNMLIITGPNMGGKSTFIRSVGTAVLMAHVGSFVPCSEATISMVDSILGRIGASDNIIKGLSTFMVEMIETSGIIRNATENSLVIIDELGRGTSTYEGGGIAWSIAEHLAKESKCFTLFATHFHEITNLAETVETVKNYHMAAVADEDNFSLLYQVRPGVTEKSFGIQVAKLANFPDTVVQRAQEVYNEFEDENAEKQTEEDKVFLKKIDVALEKLTTSANSMDMNEADLALFVQKFQTEIRELNSEYFQQNTTTTTAACIQDEK